MTYALPAAAQPRRLVEPRPDVLRAEPGSYPPPGYHGEERPRVGLIVAGAITAAAGGLLLLGGVNEANRERGDYDMDYSPAYYTFGGIHLAVGVPLLMFGLLDKKRVFVRDTAGLEIVPELGVGRHAAHGRLRWVF